MAKGINRLTARSVETLKKPGRHADGAGLYLHVDASGAKRWVFVYFTEGRRREMGLGSVDVVTLAEARELRDAKRRLVHEGKDPIAERRRVDEAKPAPIFGDYAKEVVRGLPLTSEKYRKQWERTLTELPVNLQDLPVDQIGVEEVLEALKPHWKAIPETAERLRGRIEHVLYAAKAEGHVKGPWENPARWRGHIELLLPKPARKTRHHAALPYEEAGDFMAALRRREGSAARALEFTILTAGRTSQTRFLTAKEIDLAEKLWVIPAERMKMKRDHRVPLTDRIIEILQEARIEELEPDDHVFPSLDLVSPLSDGGMERVLDRMGYRGKVTVHGFRSTFKDWAEDCTHFQSKLIEAALAHLVGDETERAYRRGDALQKRRKLMEAWEGYCATPAGEKIRQLRPGAAGR